MTAPGSQECAFTFPCEGAELVGVVHRPAAAAHTGVLIVVGGPQYRVGSHRQFLLLARSLAAEGIPAMRFDHRGVGDSEGDFLGFEALDADIGAAIDAFFAKCPELTEVVLWGLCDAASAILFYAHRDPRVGGVVLLNPWVRTLEGEARAVLRHYYLRRLAERDFWQRLASGRFRPWESATSLLRLLARRFGARTSIGAGNRRNPSDLSLPERMAAGLASYHGPVLLILSGRDLTAREFEDVAAGCEVWRRLLAEDRIWRRDLEPADHTFSRRAWRDILARWTLEWLRER